MGWGPSKTPVSVSPDPFSEGCTQIFLGGLHLPNLCDFGGADYNAQSLANQSASSLGSSSCLWDRHMSLNRQ